MSDINSFLTSFISIITRISINDIIDISIVAYIFYKIFMFIKDTRAAQVLKGIILLLVATQLSDTFRLHTLYWILVNALKIGLLAACIIFQPELRAGLEHIGRAKLKFFGKNNFNTSQENMNRTIEEIVESLYSLSRQKIGALIIMERQTKIGDIINTGTILDAEVSRQLLINIFIPNTPLHDGAVVIRDSKVTAAACFLPLTQSKDLSKDLGTRHRAGVGVSEVSDCITLIVSEETGDVSIAKAGKLYRNISKERMTNILRSNLKIDIEDKSFFKGGIFR
ncbi:TIGR00159 family protein [Romboutsia maritimum]|uniref:Diadenylate cyclase n=1 Tax=Romboutsia maritimum TaxID=2020948 RepID=A0A371IPM9_9FIRM|nr:diadenylate cyclase CdaA [Romboutsia maritimum]RDY22423.1 TIGR00159 family protein [Romboutsia maritimum]